MKNFLPYDRVVGFLCLGLSVSLAGCGGPVTPATSQAPVDAKAIAEKEATSPEPSSRPVEVSKTQYSGEAFRLAAHDGNLDIVRKAMKAGTEVDAADADRKYTALLMAAYNGHTHVVKFLLDRGATVDVRDHEGKTPLMHAASGPFAATVTMLIDAGADVNATETTEGFTPLMTAAAMGEAEVVRILLDQGADPSIVDEDNDTAKDHARNAGKTDIVAMLP